MWAFACVSAFVRSSWMVDSVGWLAAQIREIPATQIPDLGSLVLAFLGWAALGLAELAGLAGLAGLACDWSDWSGWSGSAVLVGLAGLAGLAGCALTRARSYERPARSPTSPSNTAAQPTTQPTT